MKPHLPLFLAFIMAASFLTTRAQFGNIIVFAPKGEKFTLYLGSTMQNSEPAARVEADKPGGPSFKIKVLFPDPSIKEISKLVFNKPNETIYYKVGKNPKGVYVLESTASEWMDESAGKDAGNPPPNRTETTSPDKKESKSKEGEHKETSQSTDAKGCENPMNEIDFAVALAQVNQAPFDGPKLSAAKKMADSHCLMVWEVKEVIHIFDQESSRLSFAKYAYPHTYDKENYDEVKEALHAEKSRMDLDTFLKSKTK